MIWSGFQPATILYRGIRSRKCFWTPCRLGPPLAGTPLPPPPNHVAAPSEKNKYVNSYYEYWDTRQRVTERKSFITIPDPALPAPVLRTQSCHKYRNSRKHLFGSHLCGYFETHVSICFGCMSELGLTEIRARDILYRDTKKWSPRLVLFWDTCLQCFGRMSKR